MLGGIVEDCLLPSRAIQRVEELRYVGAVFAKCGYVGNNSGNSCSQSLCKRNSKAFDDRGEQ